MALSLVTGPTTEPVSLAEAKAHLSIESAFTNDDALIAALITAAREDVETFTRRAIPAQTYDLFFDGLPSSAVERGVLRLPLPPLQSVTWVKYLDMSGVLQTWTPMTQYEVDAPQGPKAVSGRITPVYLGFWPVVRPSLNAFQVRFVAGYAPGPTVAVLSITQAAGVATVTTATAHGYRQAQIVTLAGANQAGYVGDFPVVAVLSATQFSIAVPSSTVSPATGTITAQAQGVPQALKHAILMTLEHYYENRGTVERLEGGENMVEIPKGAEAVAWPYRALEFD